MNDKIDKPWFVNVNNNAMIYMSNTEYLNHLLEKSRKMVSPRNKTSIRFLIWDLEAIKEEEPSFYKIFSYKIENEISNLKRILKLEPYPHNKNKKLEEGSSSNNFAIYNGPREN